GFTVPSGADEAVTWLVAGALTGGNVSVGPIDPTEISAELAELEASGLTITRSDNQVAVSGRPTHPLRLTTGPPPEIGSDMQPIFGALATAIEGASHIIDRRFTERFQYLEALRGFGVDCHTHGNSATIVGADGNHLRPADVEGGDLRGTMAAILTALRVDGVSVIGGGQHLERGYLEPAQRFNALGARVTRLL
ncbi:MAG: UDP-N-acetylglucosamine 1-carboxyvinyltransferase, partial [Myxococcota bacterium]